MSFKVIDVGTHGKLVSSAVMIRSKFSHLTSQ